jgi:hypothetical protein
MHLDSYLKSFSTLSTGTKLKNGHFFEFFGEIFDASLGPHKNKKKIQKAIEIFNITTPLPKSKLANFK